MEKSEVGGAEVPTTHEDKSETDDGPGGVVVDDQDDYLSEQEYFSEEVSTASEPEPDVWRCERCRKDFKSHGQMENHMKSKKHKVALKKIQAAKQRRKLKWKT